MEPLWGSGHLWEPKPELQLQLKTEAWFKPCLGLWPGVPETLSDGDTSTFPKFGVNDVDKLTELAAAPLGSQLDFLGLYEGLDSLGTCAHGMSVVDVPLLVVLFGKACVSQELWIYFLLDAFSVPFSELVVHGGVPGLGHICTEACSTWNQKSQQRSLSSSVSPAPQGISCFPHLHRRWQFLVFRLRLLSLVSDPAEAAALASSEN